MTVITHARTQASEIHLRDLTPFQRKLFGQLMDTAELAPDNQAYFALHAAAATAIGMPLPASRELAQCTCLAGCYCDLVFDAVAARTYLPDNGATEVVQCPDCAHDHRHGDQD